MVEVISRPMKPDEVLERAINLINEKGWGQGTAVNPDTGAICAAQAIWLASFTNVPDSYTNALIVSRTEIERDNYTNASGALMNKTRKEITMWNDDPRRTKDEVINTMREVIAELRGA